jgi:hypothetical protein
MCMTNLVSTPSFHITLIQVLVKLQRYLSAIASNGKLLQAVRTAFGDRINSEKLEYLRQDWEKCNFETLPKIQICPSEEINGLNSIFSPTYHTIYLAQEYVCWKSTQTCEIVATLIEAIGCFIDREINPPNSTWGHGLLFAECVFDPHSDSSL